MELNIFDYFDYRDFLKDFFKDKKKVKATYSYEVFSRKADLSRITVSSVVRGIRNITYNTIPKFVKGLELSKPEGEYFRNLVLLNQLEQEEKKGKEISFDLKFQYVEKLEELRAQNQRVISLNFEKFSLFSKWYIVTIYELIGTRNFVKGPKIIAKRLKNKITEEEAKEALRVLSEVGLIEKDKVKGWKRKHKAISFPDAEQFKIGQYRCLLDLLDLAKDSLINSKIQEVRNIGGVSFAVGEKDIKKIEKKIVEFRKEINKLSSNFKNTDKVYQLNLSFFPLTT